MRKAIIFLLVIVLSFAAAGCGGAGGVDLSDIESKLEDLQDRIAELEDENGRLKDDIAALTPVGLEELQETITALEGQITALQTQLGSLGGDLTALEGQIAILEQELEDTYKRTESFFDWDNPIVIESNEQFEELYQLWYTNHQLFVTQYQYKVIQATGIFSIINGIDVLSVKLCDNESRNIFSFYCVGNWTEFNGESITLKGVLIDSEELIAHYGRLIADM